MTHIVPITSELLSADSGTLAERRLRESPYYFLKRLTCRFSAGVLTLCGTVPNHQLKPIAETIVWRVPGVRAVVNQVEVVDPNRTPWTVPAVRNAG